MASSTQITPSRVRAALTLRNTSVPEIANKHGANVKTCYAVLHGNRPGHCAKVKRAVAEMSRITQEELSHA